jgi:hypothetical protein
MLHYDSFCGTFNSKQKDQRKILKSIKTKQKLQKIEHQKFSQRIVRVRVRVMVFNATFNNTSVIEK